MREANTSLSDRILRVAAAFFLFLLGSSWAAAEQVAETPIALDMRIAGDDQLTRIVVEFDRPVEVEKKLLDRPWRLVLDFGKIRYGFSEDAARNSDLVSGIRYGDMGERHSRIILEVARPFSVRNLAVRPDNERSRHNLVIDLEPTTERAFADAKNAMPTRSAVVNVAQKRDRLGVTPTRRRAFTVIIDPGHGGIDYGARGVRGTLEKDVTLAFAQTLQNRLARYDGAEAYLTRETDVFVSLADRTGFARQHAADLFISVHADYLRQRDVRGATIYTISEKASDSVAEALAEDHNLADSVAGVEIEREAESVTDILVDLARRETLGFSVQFARLAISDMKGFARLIKNPHRFAGFRVLKAPDVPSVLIELGYLSNPDDEQLLNDTEWRDELAERLALAVEKFAALSARELAGAGGGG